jgi:hypothetical protein
MTSRSERAGALFAACFALAALAPALGASAGPGVLAGDYPAFRQDMGERLSIHASNLGSRRWACSAALPDRPEGPSAGGRTIDFHVHPHSRDELVGSMPMDGDVAAPDGPARIHCRAD